VAEHVQRSGTGDNTKDGSNCQPTNVEYDVDRMRFWSRRGPAL